MKSLFNFFLASFIILFVSCTTYKSHNLINRKPELTKKLLEKVIDERYSVVMMNSTAYIVTEAWIDTIRNGLSAKVERTIKIPFDEYQSINDNLKKNFKGKKNRVEGMYFLFTDKLEIDSNSNVFISDKNINYVASKKPDIFRSILLFIAIIFGFILFTVFIALLLLAGDD